MLPVILPFLGQAAGMAAGTAAVGAGALGLGKLAETGAFDNLGNQFKNAFGLAQPEGSHGVYNPNTGKVELHHADGTVTPGRAEWIEGGQGGINDLKKRQKDERRSQQALDLATDQYNKSYALRMQGLKLPLLTAEVQEGGALNRTVVGARSNETVAGINSKTTLGAATIGADRDKWIVEKQQGESGRQFDLTHELNKANSGVNQNVALRSMSLQERRAGVEEEALRYNAGMRPYQALSEGIMGAARALLL
jgi:hypothetical protein